MIQLNVTATNIAVSGVETLTSGRVGLKCAFTFSAEWGGLQKIATFVGSQERSVPVDTNEVTIPWECFTDAENYRLTVAVKGTKPDGTVVLPTVYAVIGKIQRGAESAEEGAEPTPSVVAQIQSNAANALAMAQNVIGRADRGEFNGAKGDKGDTGDTGATGATGAKGDKGDKGDTGATGAQGAPGQNGQDGYTPVRGTDYWTASDKAEIVEDVAAEINYDPVSKTADMTQSVGVDVDGKLFTQPGQEEKYELIEEITLSEAASSIERSTDTQSVAYSFVSAYVDIKYPNSTIASGNVQASFYYDQNIPTFWGTANNFMVQKSTATSAPNASHVFALAENRRGIGKYAITEPITNAGNALYQTRLSYAPVIVYTGDAKINKIKLDKVTNPFPVGTVIKIYGVRA